MIKTELCEALGIKHPIIQAGMGPFGTNKLCIAAANAGVLGLISSSGVDTRETQPQIYKFFIETGGATLDDDKNTVLQKIFRQTLEGTREHKGIFGINVMVSAEIRTQANETIDAAIQAVEEDPEMKERFRIMFTSAGDPMPWGEKIKGAGFKWLHVVPSVKGALRCKKAGVDVIVASGHEGGFHTAWEPVHSMVLLPAVVEALADSDIPVVGAGGFCDGKTLAAALSLGAAGVQMGTRFLATRESDFVPLWKESIVEAGDRGTLIARGIVGPARWIKTPSTLEHAENTVKASPGVYLGKPDDMADAAELVAREREGLIAAYTGDKEKAMLAGGECAQRIDNLPPVEELVANILEEAEDIVRNLPKRYLA
jgi:NAD(P)H-dependent flavin oxidoreductase YrpB (nitropropane dioxygenase family)